MKLAKRAFLGWHVSKEFYTGRDKLYTGNAIHVANPHDSPKLWSDRVKLNSSAPSEWRYGARYNRYLFRFGSIGTTYVLVYAGSLDDGLEIAAEWLAEHEMWGHITPHSEELGCDCKDPFECEEHTYTESGWLTSHEWFVDEPVTNADLRRIHKG